MECKKIRVYSAPHLEVKVYVSDVMIKDYRECHRLIEEGKSKDCDTCSWNEVQLTADTNACELPSMEQLLEDTKEKKSWED